MKKLFRLTILIAFVLLCGCTHPPTQTHITRELMGTIVEITAIGNGNDSKLNDTIHMAFQSIERIDNIMSTYKNDSEVFILNRDSILLNASDDLIYVIKKALYYSNLSNGAFDITVGSILNLYSKSFKQEHRPPTEKEINETLTFVGYNRIKINGSDISIGEGMQITLGGIAKGYAVDVAVDVLKRAGVKDALVNAGGDIRTIGDKRGEGWTVALENPRNEGEYITRIKLNNKAIATSGDYERYFDPKKKFHHIINPRTGYSALSLISVTIIADKAIDADALATAVFVLGPQKGLSLIESIEDTEALLITNNRTIIRSSGFSMYEF